MSLSDKLFVSSDVIERKVALGDGSEETLYFKQIGHEDFNRFLQQRASEDEDVRAGCTAKLIVASLCEPDGTQAISFSKACQLKPLVANEIIKAILEINGVGEKKE